MQKAELLALAERVEAMEGPDMATARDVAKAYGWHRVEPRHTKSKHGAWISPEDWIAEYSGGAPILDSRHGTTMHRDVADYTASIDAVLTLFPYGWLVVHLSELGGAGGCICKLGNPGSSQEALSDAGATTMALALLAASLRAKAGGL